MTVLTPALLDRIRSRAAGYDAENTFFAEDLDELRAAGYLAPRSLLETVRDQRLLAAYAPATALGINMHLVWVGVARVLRDRGDHSLDWVLDDAAAGELFAFGNSEPGNDLVLWDSLTTATAVDGGYAFTGTKIFTSLAPAWTRLGVFGKAMRTPTDPVSSTASSPVRAVAGAVSTTGTPSACAPPRATPPCSTARSCPRSASRASCRSAEHGSVRLRHLRELPAADRLGVRRHRRPRARARGRGGQAPHVAQERGGRTRWTPTSAGDRGCRARPRRPSPELETLAARRRRARRPRRGLVPPTHGCEAPRTEAARVRRGPRDALSRRWRLPLIHASWRACSATCSPASTTRATPSRCTRPSRRTCWARWSPERDHMMFFDSCERRREPR